MWFERFVIIVTSLHRDYLPSSWAMFSPTIIDVGIYVGTLGLFFTLFLLFAKYFPVINMFEVKTILKSSSGVAHPIRIIIQCTLPIHQLQTIQNMTNKKYVLGVYDDEEVLLHAIENIRAAGTKIHEVFSPFPIHGIDDALGIERSRLPIAAFFLRLLRFIFRFVDADLYAGF